MNKLKNMAFFPLCQGEHRKSQIFFIFDGILINAAATLTNGVFLSGYLVSLKASDFLVGILNNSATWSLIISLFSFLIFERMEKRKDLLITLNIISRALICSIVFLPQLIKDSDTVLALTSGIIIAGNLLWSIYSVGIIVWMISLLPNKAKNRYIYLRMLCLRFSFTFFTLIMGLVLDWFGKSQTGFTIVFSVSLVLSLIDAIVLMNTHEPANNVDRTRKSLELGLFLEPLKNKEFRTYLLFIFCFYFSLNLSSSYTALYQIRYLKLNYSFISIINVIAYVNMIVCTQLWGKLEYQKGLKFVLGMTALFIVSEFFLYGFMTQKTLYLLFLTPFLAGIGNSGFNVATVTYRYNIIPEEGHKTIYEGWFGAVFGLSALLGPMVGKLIMEILPPIRGPIFQYSNFQIMYLISFIVGLSVVLLMFFRPLKKQQKPDS